MNSPRALLREIMPGFARNAYRTSRLAFRSAFRSMAGEVTCRVRGIEIRLGVSTEAEQERAEGYAADEPETLDWLDEQLRDGDVFFDIGANVGLYSLYAAAARPCCTVYAFEPAASTYSRLCANIVINGLNNIVPCQMPLAQREAFELFYLGDLQSGSALHALGRPSDFRPAAPVLKQGVLSASLDGLVLTHGLSQPSLMKIDVDGSEANILAGGASVLGSTALRSVLIELTSAADREGMPQAGDHLVNAGLDRVAVSGRVWTCAGLCCRNYIFTRPAKAERD